MNYTQHEWEQRVRCKQRISFAKVRESFKLLMDVDERGKSGCAYKIALLLS